MRKMDKMNQKLAVLHADPRYRVRGAVAMLNSVKRFSEESKLIAFMDIIEGRKISAAEAKAMLHD